MLSLTILWVSGVVAVRKHASWLCLKTDQKGSSGNHDTLTALSTLLFKKLNGTGVESPSWRCIPIKSIVLPSSRAGVPVCKRPSLNPAFFNEAESPVEGLSPSLPAGKRFIPKARIRILQLINERIGVPIWISPDRNVPVQMTTWEQDTTSPDSKKFISR